MTDKIRLIYNKIENRIDEICDDGFVLKENQQEYETLTDLEDFIDSLQEESKCIYNRTLEERKKSCKYCSAFCTVRIKEEPASDDLDEEILNKWEEYPHTLWAKCPYNDFKNIARHFAEWQHGKDYDQAMQDFLKKAEPKFKVGDWVVVNNREIGLRSPLHIVDFDETQYRVEDVDGNSGCPKIEYLEELYHLWTIEDAKVGDVLVGNYDNCKKPWIGIFKCISKDRPTTQFDSYCFLNSSHHIFTTPSSGKFNQCKGHTIRYALPATKEQRDLLFQKMKEAGYKWDANNKELEKTEHNSDDLNLDIQNLVDRYKNKEEYDKDGNYKGRPVNCMIRAYKKGIRDAFKLKDINTAWSEEDELIFTSIIQTLKLTNGAAQIKIDWLVKKIKNG